MPLIRISSIKTQKMNGVKAKQISDYAVTISVLLYVVACFVPTGVGYGNEKSMGCRGIVCLLMGWFGAFSEYTLLGGGWMQMVGDKWSFFLTSLLTAPAILWAWLSNLLYFKAMFDLFRERKAKRSLILCAIAFAARAKSPNGSNHGFVCPNECIE